MPATTPFIISKDGDKELRFGIALNDSVSVTLHDLTEGTEIQGWFYKAGLLKALARATSSPHRNPDLLADRLNELNTKLATAEKNAGAWKARADRFEGMLSEIDQFLDGIGRNSVFVDEIRRLLYPDPPFTLPTKPGSGVKARYGGTGDMVEYRLFTDGRWHSASGGSVTPERFLQSYNRHEIIEDTE